MNNQYYRQTHTERHLKLWIYLLPIVGVIPAIWTLYRPKSDRQIYSENNREQLKVSRLSLILVLVWLSSYSLLFLGAANASGMVAFRLLYTNAILTTGYFLACTVLMSRLVKKNLPPEDEINRL